MIGHGVVLGARAGLVEARLPGARVGDGVRISTRPATTSGHVCALDAASVLIAAHAAIGGIARGTAVQTDATVQTQPLGACVLGRAIDARGAPLDGRCVPLGRRVGL
ncbi:MAG: hypothetical protein ABI329_02155, partial [Candidatus Tumulicola sp.]